LTRWPFHRFTAKVPRTIDGSAWTNPAYIDLRPQGASSTMKMATFHPPRLLIERGEGNSVGVLFTETEWFDATLVDDDVLLRIPLAEYEQANALLLAKQDLPKHTRKRLTSKVRGIFGRRRDVKSDPKDEKIERLERQLLKFEDTIKRQRAREAGALADIAALGIIPGIVPPTYKHNICRLNEGFDAVSIYVNDDGRLCIDFIEGNAMSDPLNPAYTPLQVSWKKSLEREAPILRLLEFRKNRSNPYEEDGWLVTHYTREI